VTIDPHAALALIRTARRARVRLNPHSRARALLTLALLSAYRDVSDDQVHVAILEDHLQQVAKTAQNEENSHRRA